MKTTNNYLKKILTVTALGTTLFLSGCGIFGDSNPSDHSYSGGGSGYYDSSRNSIDNLSRPDSIFSAYNETTSLECYVPVDSSKEVLYACLVTNPNHLAISELGLTPPLAYSARASLKENSRNTYDSFLSNTVLGNSRESFAKLQLQKKLLEMYEKQKGNNYRASANSSHIEELAEGQTNIPVKVLGEKRTCTLAKISNHAKILIDENSYKLLNKCSISPEKLEELSQEFEKYLYPVMKENFGDGSETFWSDVDKDGRLSIVISPIVNYFETSGDQPGNVVGIFDTSNINGDNPRDMIALAVKRDEESFDKWFMDARETIAHEMQHIVNFSAKGNRSESDLWIDEGLAVCAEILYRKKRAEDHLTTYSMYYNGEHEDFAGNDTRFCYYAYCYPEIPVKSFATNGDETLNVLAHYGQKGLFFYYIFEQCGGSDAIKRLCRGKPGLEKFNGLCPYGRTLEQLIIDFNFATLYEKFRNLSVTKLSKNPFSLAGTKHRFSTNMNLNFIVNKDKGIFEEITEKMLLGGMFDLSHNEKKNLLSTGVLRGNGGTLRFMLRQPKDFGINGEASVRLLFNSNLPVVVNMVRMTD